MKRKNKNIKLIYPTGEFSVNDLVKLNTNQTLNINRSIITVLLREAEEDGIVTRVRSQKIPGRRGKAANIYLKNKTPVLNNKSKNLQRFNILSLPANNFTVRQFLTHNKGCTANVANQYIQYQLRNNNINIVSKQKNPSGRGKPANLYARKDKGIISFN